MVLTQLCSKSSTNTHQILKDFVQYHLGYDVSLLASTSPYVKWRDCSCLFCMASKTMWKSNRLLKTSYSGSFKIIPKAHDNNHELVWLQWIKLGPKHCPSHSFVLYCSKWKLFNCVYLNNWMVHRLGEEQLNMRLLGEGQLSAFHCLGEDWWNVSLLERNNWA